MYSNLCYIFYRWYNINFYTKTSQKYPTTRHTLYINFKVEKNLKDIMKVIIESYIRIISSGTWDLSIMQATLQAQKHNWDLENNSILECKPIKYSKNYWLIKITLKSRN